MIAPMQTTILVVEDEPSIQELICINVHMAGYKAIKALSAEAARKIINAQLPDLILLDWMLPGMSGIEMAKYLRAAQRTKNIPIIMLTAKSTEENTVQGLEAGADDYISKPFSPKELLARIKAVLRRRAPQHTNDLINIAALSLDPDNMQLTISNQAIHMGPTEFRLLHFFMAHPDKVFSRSQLLDQVWGDHVFLEERTVDVHIRRLRKLLSPNNAARHIETIRGAGYKFSTNPNV